MSRYLIKQGKRGMVSLDENDDFDIIDYMRTNIDWVYEVPEDGVLEYKTEDKVKMYDVKKGNFVIQFYTNPNNVHDIIIIDNKEWKENVDALKKIELERATGMCETCICSCEARD